jgi:hypothetical protein
MRSFFYSEFKSKSANYEYVNKEYSGRFINGFIALFLLLLPARNQTCPGLDSGSKVHLLVVNLPANTQFG